MRVFTVLVLSLFFFTASAQKKIAFISGQVTDENEKPLANVSVTVLGKKAGIITNDSGFFRIKVTSTKPLALIFSYTGYAEMQKNFYLSENEEEKITVQLQRGSKTLQTVTIGTAKERTEIGLIKINPKNALVLPSSVGGIEGLIKILVGSNNELTSQYSVRGGNYDENLVYINDFEIFRPYLVRSGQQEGLSFINPEMTKNVNFYNGGFQAKYGDKMSSVLDIQYKKPHLPDSSANAKRFGGSAYISLLEQGIYLEGINKDGRATYMISVRNKSNRNLLNSQETSGYYYPASTDVQASVTYKLNNKWQLEMLGIASATKFTLIPESVQKTSAVFTPMFTANLGLDIVFDGREEDNYTSSLIGLTAIQQVSNKVRLKWMLNRYGNQENENFDIGSAYLFGERDFDNASSTYGQIVNPLGAGFYRNYGRNELNIAIYNAALKGSIDYGKHFIQFGNSIQQQKMADKLYEWEYQDSAAYSLPVNTDSLKKFVNSAADLSVQTYSGFVQDNINFTNSKADIFLQAGLRYNYNTLNKEFLLSPRAEVSVKPRWKKDVVFKFAAGIYDQPPFYRELRRYDGTLNTNILSQKSYQFVAGMDYNFATTRRPFRITTEAYYKNIKDLIPYDIDNLKIRYSGENNAKAYAYGLETRLYSELVKDAESWLSVGLMSTKENIENDYYYNYLNKDGEVIGPTTPDKVPVDSVKEDVGWVRRPTDRLLTVGLFLQDYLSTNKNFRVHLNIIYGSNMPFNIPDNPKYRNALIIDPYIRVDIGFSALLYEKNKARSHSPFRAFDNIWASFEVYNLIDRPNTISYQTIKDFSNTVYSIPNRLTPRLINFKILGRF
jgi:hypothetical protein